LNASKLKRNTTIYTSLVKPMEVRIIINFYL